MPLNVKLCGAKARQNNHQPCKQPAIKNKKRCRMHGGLSTGPRTLEGKMGSTTASLKHSLYSKAAMLERSKIRMMLKWHKEDHNF